MKTYRCKTTSKPGHNELDGCVWESRSSLDGLLTEALVSLRPSTDPPSSHSVGWGWLRLMDLQREEKQCCSTSLVHHLSSPLLPLPNTLGEAVPGQLHHSTSSLLVTVTGWDRGWGRGWARGWGGGWGTRGRGRERLGEGWPEEGGGLPLIQEHESNTHTRSIHKNSGRGALDMNHT